ncbi:MAG: hypothetical protein QM784_26990 [Polyangiaceae bacterium]
MTTYRSAVCGIDEKRLRVVSHGIRIHQIQAFDGGHPTRVATRLASAFRRRGHCRLFEAVHRDDGATTAILTEISDVEIALRGVRPWAYCQVLPIDELGRAQRK